MMPFDSAEFFKNSIDCVKGNIVKWRKEQEQRNLNLELLENKIRDSENRMYVAEMKLEMMTERKEVAENEAALLKEAYEKVYCFWKCFDLFVMPRQFLLMVHRYERKEFQFGQYLHERLVDIWVHNWLIFAWTS